MIMSFKAVTESPTVVSGQTADLQQSECLFRDDVQGTILMLPPSKCDADDTDHGEYLICSAFRYHIEI